MNITVLGTSNSLMRHGYVFALRGHPDVASVENFSLGASSALAFTFMTSKSTIMHNRYCILEYAVNQHSFLRQGYQKASIEDEIIGCVATIAKRGGIPIFLLLPRQRWDAKSSRIRTLYLAIAERLGVPVFDGIAWTDSFSSINRLDRTTLFKDDGHLAPWVATALAVDLVEFLRKIEVNNSPSTEILLYSHHYFTVPLPQTSSGITRESSLFSQRFSTLQLGQDVLVRIPDDAVVCGIGLNIPMASVAIEFSGDSVPVQYDFRNGFAQRSKSPFIHIILSLPKTIAPIRGVVRMKILSADEVERDAFRMFPSRKSVHATNIAEVSTLICASRERTTTALTAYKVHSCSNSNSGTASITAQMMRTLYTSDGRPEDSAALDV
jgi:hypothetical protein